MQEDRNFNDTGKIGVCVNERENEHRYINFNFKNISKKQMCKDTKIFECAII
ncbi:TPA: hypothetical protein R1934_000965 [Staphylococcus delphini]|nr:hypothetical protein [Staphylococcus delphini]